MKNLLIFFTICLIGCKSSGDDEMKVDDIIEEKVIESKINAEQVFLTLPDRTEILKLIDENKIT
jgi:hypothetical protein